MIERLVTLSGWRRSRAASGSEEDATAPRTTPLGLIVTAAWAGLATGLLELGLVVLRMRFYSVAALGALQVNRHFPWMIPVANLILFGACGLAFGLASRFRPRTAARLAGLSFCFLSSLTLLLGLQRLHAIACIVLALGLTCRLAPWLMARSRWPGRMVRFSLPVLALVVLVLAGLTYDRLARAERRALAGLPKASLGAPNVLLIVLDTVRADHLSLYGYARETTPHLTRLARRGTRFQQARATAPWTLPSHASMFTGRWPSELFSGKDQPLDATYPTLAEFLRDRGYETAGFVANTYYCNSWFGLGRGFIHYEDHYDNVFRVSPGAILYCSELGKRLLQAVGTTVGADARRKDAARINREFLSWLAQQGGDRPFFAFLNYLDAHDPYLLPAGLHRHFGLIPTTPTDFSVLYNWLHLDKRNRPAREIALGRDAYDDCIAALDEQLGQLFDALQRRGLFRNTLVIVTSDHGEHLGEHQLYSHGQSLYRPEVEVPLLIVAPSGVPAGQVVRAPVSLRDLPATIVDWLGLGSDSPFPGRSLARYWDPARASDPTPPEPILSEMELDEKDYKPHSEVPAQRGRLWAQLLGSRVYIGCGDGGEELYDLESDPAELHNLIGSARERPVLEQCRRALDQRIRR